MAATVPMPYRYTTTYALVGCGSYATGVVIAIWLQEHMMSYFAANLLNIDTFLTSMHCLSENHLATNCLALWLVCRS